MSPPAVSTGQACLILEDGLVAVAVHHDLAQGAAPLASALVKSVYLDMMVYSVQVDTRDTIKVTVSNRLMR